MDTPAPASLSGPTTRSSPLPQDPGHQRWWLWGGYLLAAALLLFRLGYIASGRIELSNDEAYQWVWSKHLALSYVSKPPGIAFIQFLGTRLWGDTQLGVRFFSPVFAAILSVVALRFMAQAAGARPAFLLLLILTSAPLMGVGTVLMTIDPPLVLCWTLAMLAGWRAMQPQGATSDWLWAGLAAGLGFLSKYSAAYLLISWAVFFALWRPARVHLRRPGPYLALLVFAVCTLPVLIWNAQNDWATVRHVAGNAGVGTPWHPTLNHLLEFFFVEAGLLNPVFFGGALWAMVALRRVRRENPLGLYFFCTGGLVFLGHLAYSLYARILPNWIAPAVLPMYCWMVLYWDSRWRQGLRAVKSWLVGGLVLGFLTVTLMHYPELIGKAIHPLPGDADPLRRVRGYREAAREAETARQRLAGEGKAAFIICDHYGITSLFSFYLPEARKGVGHQPLVYCLASHKPNQFYFWPEYRYAATRQGQNAIYVCEPPSVELEKRWFWKWLRGREVGFAKASAPMPAAPSLAQEFESVTDLGVREIKVDGRIMKRVQLFECRNLR